jgi:hypothetical protein
MIERLSKSRKALLHGLQRYQFKPINFILLLIIVPAFAWANPGSGGISGVVYDADNQEPIPGVTVMMLNGYAGTSSGPDGRFILKNLSDGIYSLQVSSIGFHQRNFRSI